MKLSDFDYNLPKELIAQYPLPQRDACRLMVLDRKAQSIEHRTFSDILSYVDRSYLVVLNDTKVLPCRLKGFRSTGGKVELLLFKRKEGLCFSAIVRPARLRLQEKISFNQKGITAELTAANEVSFTADSVDSIYALGVMPLPPYIKREPASEDSQYYQTVYAAHPGAVAAPTAGLHFTEELIGKLKSSGADVGYLTLHVGPGTFMPVKHIDITVHKMQPEYFQIPPETRELIIKSGEQKKRILAVGTTVLRALEAHTEEVTSGYTGLFIYPGYKFKLVDCLLTNFHLPRTTLFMLACAFCAASAYGGSGGAGYELIKKAYQEAIAEKYRFYSYGDAMLIL